MDGIKTKINTDNIEFHTRTQQNQQYVTSKNPLERNPKKDKFENKEKTKLITYGTITALLIAAGIEFFAFKGKHIEELISKFKNKKPNNTPKTEVPKKETPKVNEVPKVEPTENKIVEELTPENKVIEEAIPENKVSEKIVPETKVVEEIIPEE